MSMVRKQRDKEIEKLRRKGYTLEEIGHIYKITKERVRQILDKDYKEKRKSYAQVS